MSVIPRQSSTVELGDELGVAPNLDERNTEKREREGGRGETLFLAVVKAWNFRRGGGG
jgi:hypothetical protein